MYKAPVQISRDPFARTTLVRRVGTPRAYNHPDRWVGPGKRTTGCTECGQFYRTLYEYGTEPDSTNGRVNWHKGLFCGKGCHDSFHA